MRTERFATAAPRDGVSPMLWRMAAVAVVGFGVLCVLVLLTGAAGHRERAARAPETGEPVASGAEPHRARLLRHGSSRTSAPMEL
jgi:hypothetical protein